MTLLTLQRKYGCLLANNNRLAKEIYNSLAIISHTGTLPGSRDKAVSEIGLPPASRPSIDKVVRDLALKKHLKKPKDILEGFSWAPFTPVPNVRSMNVSSEGVNEIFQHFKIHRSNKKLSFKNYTNKPKMRYAAMMISRLRTYEDRRFWLLAWVIMKRSVVFSLMALNKSFPRWHRELPIKLVMSWLFGVHKLSGEMYTQLRFKRIYIPKPNGKLRPLGVPAPVWRILFTILNWILITRLARYIPDWQHAYLPGKGTKSAWEVILKSTIKRRYIYEFDLNQFFPSVHPPRVLKWFQDRGIFPSDKDRWTIRGVTLVSKKPYETKMNIYDWIKSLSYCVPSFPQGIEQSDKDLYMGTADVWTNPIWAPEEFDENGKVKNFWFSQIAKFAAVPISSEWGNYGRTYGWPQGANISPLMSIALLGQAETPPPYELIMYADDGIFSSDAPIDVQKVKDWFSDLGLTINEEKSGFVCWDGQWFKPLKFLGLKYRPDMLMSETRSGTKLKFDQEDLVQALLATRKERESVRVDPYIVVHKAYGRVRPEKEAQRLTIHHEGLVYRYDMTRYVIPDESWSTAEFREYVVWCESSDLTLGFHGKHEALEKAQVLNLETGAYWKVARFTLDGVCLVPNISRANSWEEIASSQYFGWIQSKLYAGSWNEEIFQNFNLKGVPKSWLYRRQPGGRKLNFANSTSYAVSDVAGWIRDARRKETWKSEFLKGNLTFKELNQLRKSIGYPALKKRPKKLTPQEARTKMEREPKIASSLEWAKSQVKILETGGLQVGEITPEALEQMKEFLLNQEEMVPTIKAWSKHGEVVTPPVAKWW